MSRSIFLALLACAAAGLAACDDTSPADRPHDAAVDQVSRNDASPDNRATADAVGDRAPLRDVSGDGPLTAVEFCRQAIAAKCTLFFTCDPAMAITLRVGANAAECAANMAAASCTPAEANCDSGQVLDVARAQACVEAVKALPCSNYDGNPEECRSLCVDP